MNKQFINAINPKNVTFGVLTAILGTVEDGERKPLFRSVQAGGKTLVYVDAVHNYRTLNDKQGTNRHTLCVSNGAAKAIEAAYERGDNSASVAFVGETFFSLNATEDRTYVNTAIHARVATVFGKDSWVPTIEPMTRMTARLASAATEREDVRGMAYASVTGYRDDYRGGDADPDKQVFISTIRSEGVINSLVALSKPGVNLDVKGVYAGLLGEEYVDGEATGDPIVDETLVVSEIGNRRNNAFYGVVRITDDPVEIESSLTDGEGEPIQKVSVRVMIVTGETQRINGGKVTQTDVVGRYVASGASASALLKRGKQGDDIVIMDARYTAQAFRDDEGKLVSYAEIRGGRIGLPQTSGNYKFAVVRTHGHVSRDVEAGKTRAGDSAATVNMVANYYNPSARGQNAESVEIATYREEAERHAKHLGVGSEIVVVGAPNGVSDPFVLKSGENKGDVVANSRIGNARISYLSASKASAS